MKTENLDIYLDDINKEYLNKLSFCALFKCRALGYKSAADFFSLAYESYNENISQNIADLMRNMRICKYIISRFEISYREDLSYLIRHPSLIPNEMDPPQSIVRKKVFLFQDIDKPGCESKKRAYDYLNGLRPRMRAAAVDRIIDQYLTMNGDEYYIKQGSLRLINDLVKIATFDENGNITGLAKEIVEDIWKVGSRR